MLFSPMNSPSSFEPTLQTRITHSRNPILSNHFPIPKTAHSGNPRKTNHFRTLHKNMGVWGYPSQNGNRRITSRKPAPPLALSRQANPPEPGSTSLSSGHGHAHS